MNDAKKIKNIARTFSSLQDLRFCKHDSASGTNLGHHNPKPFERWELQLNLRVVLIFLL